jgi:hypothetical protein
MVSFCELAVALLMKRRLVLKETVNLRFIRRKDNSL